MKGSPRKGCKWGWTRPRSRSLWGGCLNEGQPPEGLQVQHPQPRRDEGCHGLNEGQPPEGLQEGPPRPASGCAGHASMKGSPRKGCKQGGGGVVVRPGLRGASMKGSPRKGCKRHPGGRGGGVPEPQ